MSAATSMDYAPPSRVRNQNWPLYVNTEGSQVPFENNIAIRLFRLTLGENIEARHQ
jgi:hypothetical protein